MTLTFFKNNKPDTRMIEYDQAVVRLGLEKAEIEGEVERKKGELRQIGVAYDLVRTVFLRNYEKLIEEEKKEVGEKTSVLFDYDKRVANEKKNLEVILLKQKDAEDLTKEEEEQLAIAQRFLHELDEKRNKLKEDIDKLLEEKIEKEKESSAAAASSRQARGEKEKVFSELYSLGATKIKIEQEVEKAGKELKELNEIISILQVSNKEGLDVTVSFEGERKRLQEKEESLLRKEADLMVYENRLKKHCEKVGYNIEMVFK